ncbi:hypothetical protein BW42_03006 [Exiguobacterium sp. RIT341]|nr:hypothetical protein BW42_03006 [Exiguobacterium sp. RIT341]
MDDPFLPPYNTICGIYCIYRKSILEVLSGKITSFNSYKFKTNFSSDKLIEEEDFEDVLDFAIFVVISSEDSEYISHYFIGGDSERLNSILNICLGYPQAENQKILNNTLKHFNKDIVAVENMEYLDNILNEHP